MGVKKLSKAAKDEIATSAVRDLYLPGLREAWGIVEQRMTLLCKSEVYKDFDQAHVDVYRDYINWHRGVRISCLPREWCIWSDKFRDIFALDDIDIIRVDMEVPSRNSYTPHVPDEYTEQVKDILRPYMVKYFQAKGAFYAIQEVLSGLGTSRQVEEFVPELVKYLPAPCDRQVNALVPIEQINKVRGLFPRVEGGI